MAKPAFDEPSPLFARRSVVASHFSVGSGTARAHSPSMCPLTTATSMMLCQTIG